MHLAMYVDGWNMYGSLKRADIRGYGWCDFKLLAQQQTENPKANVTVKFFTSDDKPNPDKLRTKQRLWWRALEFTGCEIIQGEYRGIYEEVEESIRNSGKKWREKMTDVALASHMVKDCSRIEPDPTRRGGWRWSPGYDEAVLLTQDLDFMRAVEAVASEPFYRRVHVLLPPSDPRSEKHVAHAWAQSLDPTVTTMVRVRQLSPDDSGERSCRRSSGAPMVRLSIVTGTGCGARGTKRKRRLKAQLVRFMGHSRFRICSPWED
ncbi:MAG: hypothetical protein ABSF93_05090 [Candidatus Sulfotelmatobacter sp.]|jgi:hypothetical protein